MHRHQHHPRQRPPADPTEIKLSIWEPINDNSSPSPSPPPPSPLWPTFALHRRPFSPSSSLSQIAMGDVGCGGVRRGGGCPPARAGCKMWEERGEGKKELGEETLAEKNAKMQFVGAPAVRTEQGKGRSNFNPFRYEESFFLLQSSYDEKDLSFQIDILLLLWRSLPRRI